MAEKDTREPQRIAKLLARAGVASRREIERMIEEGRIALDGKVLDTPATLLRSLTGVTVDGNPVAAPEHARLFIFNKPTGYLVTERDPAGRKTIYDKLPQDLPRLVPVGRLDFNTEGLLLMTTDGELKRHLELPATGVPRTYRARAFGNVTQEQLEDLIHGIEIDGIRYGQIDANMERRTGANVWIELTLTEGKNREVRHVLEHLGLEVNRLIRTRYGPFELGDLPLGEIGEVRQHDVEEFRKTLKPLPKQGAGVPGGSGPKPKRPYTPRGSAATLSRRERFATGPSKPFRERDSEKRADRPAASSPARRDDARPARPSGRPDGDKRPPNRGPAKPGGNRPSRPGAPSSGPRRGGPRK